MDAKAMLSGLACPVVPVVVIHRLDDAVPLAEALLHGGISALEVTLRTSVGCEAISAMKTAIPDAVVGAGTVCSDRAYQRAADADADFIVSPGATEKLFATAADYGLPFLPGAVTGSEVLRAMECGYTTLKFFPAEISGGVPALRALSGPFPELSFMPTGGVTPDNLEAYLQLDSVCAVGGSWLTPRQMLKQRQWEGIHQLASDAVAKTRHANTEAPN